MSQTYEPPYTAGEVIRAMQSRGVIPASPAPAPDRKHRVAELFAYALFGAYLGLAVIVAALLIVQLIQH